MRTSTWMPPAGEPPAVNRRRYPACPVIRPPVISASVNPPVLLGPAIGVAWGFRIKPLYTGVDAALYDGRVPFRAALTVGAAGLLGFVTDETFEHLSEHDREGARTV